MKSAYDINRKVTSEFSPSVYRVLGAFLFTATLLLVDGSQFAVESPSSSFPQGVEAAKVAASIQANAQALKAFSYQQRMQLQVKAETKKVTLSQVTHDPNGEQVKTLLSEQPPADQEPTGGRLKRRIVDKKKGEFRCDGQY